MAKVQIIAGRRVVKKPTPVKTVEKSRKLPAPPRSKEMTGLSLKQLLKATPPYIKSNADDVVVKTLKEATTKGGLPGVRAKTQTVRSKNRQVYDTSIVGKQAGIPVSQQKHVLVSCSCGFFTYYCEVALNHWGSANIKYSNGAHPDVTNPGLHPLMCKHLVSLAKTVVEEGM